MSEEKATVPLQARITELCDGIKNLSHEINNRLGVLRMSAYFIELGTYDDQQRMKYVATINDSLDRIESCLHQLKTLRDTSINAQTD